jgi:ketosteroid isomerase-like protein
MPEKDLEVVRDQYDAVNERDWERAMSHYAEDVRLVAVDSQSIITGTFVGAEAVGRWFGDWFASFDRDLRFEIKEMTELEDGRILVVATNFAHGRASGAPVEGDVVWTYRMRDGKIIEVFGHENREEAVAPRVSD